MPRQLERPQQLHRGAELLRAGQNKPGHHQHINEHDHEKRQEPVAKRLAADPARQRDPARDAESLTQKIEELAAVAVAVAVQLALARRREDQRKEEEQQADPPKRMSKNPKVGSIGVTTSEVVVPFALALDGLGTRLARVALLIRLLDRNDLGRTHLRARAASDASVGIDHGESAVRHRYRRKRTGLRTRSARDAFMSHNSTLRHHHPLLVCKYLSNYLIVWERMISKHVKFGNKK